MIAFAGTFVLGRMGILPRLALILAIPIGAIGISRLLRGRVSNRARVIASLSYMALPLGLDMISQGRIDVLMVVAGLPFVVRRLFELMDVPGYRTVAYDEPVQFGHRGWRTTYAGQRMVLVMLTALLTAIAPSTLIVVALIVIGVFLSRLFEPDERAEPSSAWRMLGSLWLNVAVLLLPLTVDVGLAGSRALGVFGLVRGPWSTPSFAQLLRGTDGTFGLAWVGWLLPGAAVLGLVLCRGERRRIASKVASIATLTLIVSVLDARHWMGSFAPDLDVLLALYVVMLALLVGLGVSAIENDLRQAGFGWRQLLAGVAVTALIVAAVPFFAIFGSGRFDLPTSSVAESLSTVAPSKVGGYRVLWLAGPSVLPLAGWSVAPGLAAATSTNGLPGGDTLFTTPDTRTSNVVLNAVESALQGQTVRLGQLLAPAGISTIVVMNSSAPELSGVQSVPLHPVPKVLIDRARTTERSLTGTADEVSRSLLELSLPRNRIDVDADRQGAHAGLLEYGQYGNVGEQRHGHRRIRSRQRLHARRQWRCRASCEQSVVDAKFPIGVLHISSDRHARHAPAAVEWHLGPRHAVALAVDVARIWVGAPARMALHRASSTDPRPSRR